MANLFQFNLDLSVSVNMTKFVFSFEKFTFYYSKPQQSYQKFPDMFASI